ncbi:MAG: T9SS type A sorting domain-containing protein [Bacteroidota bacterium]
MRPLLLLLIFAAASPLAAQNLAPNAGFTDIGTCVGTWDADCPDDWASYAPNPSETTLRTTITGDDRALEISLDDLSAAPNGYVSGTAYYTLSSPVAGTTYRFSALVRVDSLLGQTYIQGYSKVSGTNTDFFTTRGPSSTSAWMRLSTLVTAAEGASHVVFVLGAQTANNPVTLYGSGTSSTLYNHCTTDPCGTVYFDDVVIEEVDNEAPNPDFDQTGTSCYGSADTEPCASLWSIFKSDSTDAVAYVDDTSTDNVLVLDYTNAAATGTRNITAFTSLNDVTPGERFTIRARGDTTSLQGRGYLRVYSKNGTTLLNDQQLDVDDTSWASLELNYTIPESASVLVVSVGAAVDNLTCSSSSCGLAKFDDIEIIRHPDQFADPCPAGEFYDLPERACRTRDTSYGFDESSFPALTSLDLINFATCPTRAQLADSLASGDVYVKLPDNCEISGDELVDVESNTIIEGAGVGRTILRGGDFSLAGLDLYTNSPDNVIIRDLTVDAKDNISRENPRTIFAAYADNLWFNRLEVLSNGSGVHANNAINVTLSHLASHHNAVHGIASKDCHHADAEGRPSPFTQADADTLNCNWSQDFAILSNYAFQNGSVGVGGDGIDSHASYAEIAGNVVQNNIGSFKIAEIAHHVWAHDNLIKGNEWASRAVKIATQFNGFFDVPAMDSTLASYNVAFYKNEVADNAGFAYRVERVRNLYLIENTYSNNNTLPHPTWTDSAFAQGDSGLLISLRPDLQPQTSMFVCSGTEDVTVLKVETDPYSATIPVTTLSASDSRCNLANISSIFDGPAPMAKVGDAGSLALGSNVPKQFELEQNYPNPFNPTTTIGYGVPASGRISLKVYDTMGRLAQTLRDGNAEAGRYQAVFDGARLASGLYLVALEHTQGQLTRRIMLLK